MNQASAGPVNQSRDQSISTPKRVASFTPARRRFICGAVFLLLAALGITGARAQTNVLVNGGDNPGAITADGPGATNFWTLTASVGDNIVLRLGTTNFTGYLEVYGPDGTLLSNGGGADVSSSFTATNDGAFIAVVTSFGAGGAGDYTLRLAQMPEPFSVPAAALINGGGNAGTLGVAGLDIWTLDAKAGDNIVLRLGTIDFIGYLEVFGPDGALLTSGGGADVPSSFTATNDGTFTVLVTSFGSGGAGGYTLCLAQFPEPFIVSPTPLINGGGNAGVLAPAALDIWTFTANDGDNVELRLGTTNFVGFLSVYGPDGALLTSGGGTDVPSSITATNHGAFTAIVSSFGSGGTGAYTLYLAEMPEPFTVPARSLINGGSNPGMLAAAALDIWTFAANTGDNIVLRFGTTNFTGFLSVFGPDGSLLTAAGGTDVPSSFTATNSGAFTAIVSSYGPNGIGAYTLYLAEIPELFAVPAAGLVNGGDNPGTLSPGGLDIWTFTANAGDNVALRLGTTNFVAYVSVYGPDGALLTTGAGPDVPALFTATNSGAFTVVVSSYGPNGAGNYELHLAELPELFTVPGMTLINGGNNPGSLGLGGLDIWTFTANAGDNVVLRLGTTNFVASVNVYGPDGALLTTGAGPDVPSAFTATNSGTFTALVSSYGPNGVGAYELNLADMPEPFIVPAMTLTNGGANSGTLTLGGLEIWTLTANAGDNVVLRLGTTNFYAFLNVYGPDGALLTSGLGTNIPSLFTATNSGAFTAIVSSFGPGGVGGYTLRLAEMPEPFVVPAIPLVNGGANSGSLGLGGLDIWTFTASVGENIVLRLSSPNFFVYLNLYGPDGALLESSFGNDFPIIRTATNSGAFTAIVSSFGPDGVGDYILRLAELPEPFIVPATSLINNVTNLGTLGYGGLDLWTFTASPGDSIELRLETTNFFAFFNFYGPDGVLLESTLGNDVLIPWTATNGGSYTAIVSSYGPGGFGPYSLQLADVPPGGVLTAGTFVFTRSAGLPVRISIPSLLSAAVSDTSGLADSLASVGPGTNGSTISFNSNFILFAATNNLPESFGFTVTNIAGRSAQGVIQMDVNQPVSRFTVTGILNPDGSATIMSRGIPGVSYVVQRSTDLNNWSDLGPGTAGADGSLQFTDPTPPTPAAYYRTRQN